MFWENLKKPFFVLAPMHDVTDTAFRQTVAHFGKPDVMFTEFVSVDGLIHPQSHEKIIRYYFKHEKSEKPLVAQIWGSDPKKFRIAAEHLVRLGFDGIDINMGCPDKAVIKQGGGAALILTPEIAKEIIFATKEGAGNIPVSVKTRLGFDKIIIESWIENLILAKPSAITLHARTKKELSMVPPHWDKVKLAVDVAKESEIKIIGNGDVHSTQEGILIAENYGLDGIMIGRGSLGKPWIFNRELDINSVGIKEKIDALIYHSDIFEKEFEGIKRFNNFRKHIKAYISGFRGAGELRAKMMVSKNASELKAVALKFMKDFNAKQQL
jgi:nifR3 family TIM-barrel protein